MKYYISRFYLKGCLAVSIAVVKLLRMNRWERHVGMFFFHFGVVTVVDRKQRLRKVEWLVRVAEGLYGLRLLIPVFLSCFQTLVGVLIMKVHVNWAILNCGLSDSIN